MHKLSKKILSAAMAGAISIGGLLAVPMDALAARADVFVDLPDGAWYYDYLNRAVELGLLGGTSATTFSPDRGITRAEAVTVLARVHEKLTGTKIGESAVSAFTDVPANSYYGKAVAWAGENGIVSGYGNRTFGPARIVTHGELAVMFHRYLDLLDKAALYEPKANVYKDQEELPGWVKPHVQALSGFGIFNPELPNLRVEFAPQAATKRDEASALFVRLYEKCVYPLIDSETSRWACCYDVRDDGDTPSLPLGEGRQRIISSYEEYTSLLAELQGYEDFQEVQQAVPLEVSEKTFQDSALLAVEIREAWCPSFGCGFCGVTVDGSTAKATFVKSDLEYSSVGGRGYVFLVPIPKDTATVEVTELRWTEKNYWGLN